MNKERKQFMKTCKPLLFTAMTLFAALTITVQLAAQTSRSKIITFDVPGAGKGAGQGTFAFGIVQSRAIAGWDVDTGGRFHGFLRTKGGIRKFDAPGAGKLPGYGTVAYGINPSETITGEYNDANNVFHGFVRATDGKITKFDARGAGKGYGLGTYAVSINPAG